MRRTKIVCTLGPASESAGVIQKLVKAGMDVARLNFSHGSYENHAKLMKNIRAASRNEERPVAILQDLQGPKIRFAEIEGGGVELKRGEEICFVPNTTKVSVKNKKVIAVDFADLYEFVEVGQKILLADGLMDVKALAVTKEKVLVKVGNGGFLKSHQGINLPEAKKIINPLTPKDRKDLEFGLKNGVDYVALSFVQTEKDILALRSLIEKIEKKNKTGAKFPTKIIAKIEKRLAVENFDEILKVTDGIMVARGDLGVETPLQDVPLLQKEIIKKCLAAAKPVITATQMLESMIQNPRPTRAEVSDVANAVIDHTDAVMLSAETANGKHPIEAVATMRRIIEDTEVSPYDDLLLESLVRKDLPLDTAVSNVAVRLAKNISADAMLIATISGYTARIVSRYRPELPIIVTAESDKVRRQTALSWGVVPLVLPPCKSVDELINKTVAKASAAGLIKKGHRIVVIGGQPVGKSGNVNLIKVQQL